jgi:hypothetical protein
MPQAMFTVNGEEVIAPSTVTVDETNVLKSCERL